MARLGRMLLVGAHLADDAHRAHRQGRPRGAHDLIIAATAEATHREVVSADSAAYLELPGVAVRSRRA